MIFLLQIFVILCFIGIIIVLFDDKIDYLTYSVLFTIIAIVATSFLIPEKSTLDGFILSIKWEVVIFLITLFVIVEILDDQRIFEELARRLTKKFHTNTRKFFWIICLISTISAAFIEDLSVAIIFIPIVIKSCQKMKVNPAPFLLGITICINIAATLTPFGSAQNIIISSEFGLTSTWFILNLGLFFIITTLLTLFLLDRLVLTKHIDEIWMPHFLAENEPFDHQHVVAHELTILDDNIDKKVFNRNIVALLVFGALLFIIPSIVLVGVIGVLIFIFINPREKESGKKRPNFSYYLAKADLKLVYFFICLFILVFCMEINGTLGILEEIIMKIPMDNIFIIAIFILIITSILSGFLDNAPVTIIFIPIMWVLIGSAGLHPTPLLVAFILGINLGGNFLPQGSACDMMTLELAKKNGVEDVNYKRLLKVGGLFALLHIILGIMYLALMIYVFPVY